MEKKEELNTTDNISLEEKNKIKELENEILFLKKELNESKNQTSYLLADIQNIKRNSFKEISTESYRSCSKIILEILNIYDDFQRCFENLISENKNKEGLELINKSFLKTLSNLDVTEIKTDIDFDPKLHDSITHINDSNKKNDSIVSVAKKGYFYKGIVIRPAQVILNVHNA